MCTENINDEQKSKHIIEFLTSGLFFPLCYLPVLLNSSEVLNFKLTTTKNQTNLITSQHRERDEERKGEGMRKGARRILREGEIEK